MRRCHYCNSAPGATRDHIVPRALGGPNISWNYVRACSQCNADKGHSWPTCPCGACSLAVEMFLWAKARGGTRACAEAAVDVYRDRLWAERVVRLEWWEDAAWINTEVYRQRKMMKAQRRRWKEEESA